MGVLNVLAKKLLSTGVKKDYAKRSAKMKPSKKAPGVSKMLQKAVAKPGSIADYSDKLAKAKLELKRHDKLDSSTMHEALERRVRVYERGLKELKGK